MRGCASSVLSAVTLSLSVRAPTKVKMRQRDASVSQILRSVCEAVGSCFLELFEHGRFLTEEVMINHGRPSMQGGTTCPNEDPQPAY